MATADCVTHQQLQEVKAHMRLQVDSEAGRGITLEPLGQIAFILTLANKINSNN